MTQQQKNKLFFWLFKVFSIIISAVLPIWAICEKFPLWTQSYGTGRSVGSGLIMIAVVLVAIFHKTVFAFLSEKLKIKHAPPILMWVILLICSYALMLLVVFIQDLITVLWMGLLGCALGNILTLVGNCFMKEEDDE